MDAEGKESWRNQLIFFKKSFNLWWAVWRDCSAEEKHGGRVVV